MKYMKWVVGVILLLVIINATPTDHAEASTKKYLVLVQEDSNKWTAYNNLIEVTTTGFIMLKAKQFSNIMDFTYIENTSKKQFSIKRSKGRYNTYTTNSTKYTYTNKGKTTNKKANFKSYKSKVDNNNLCIAGSVNTLCNFMIFTGDGTQEYQNLGYDGVLCYSLKAEISKVPNTIYVRYSDGSGLKKRLSSDVIYADVDADGYVNITLLDSIIDGMSVVYQVGDENVLNCSWGEFSNDIVPLYVHVKSVGMTFINVFLEDYSEYITIILNVTSVPGASDSGNEGYLNKPEQTGSVYLTTSDDTYKIEGTLTWNVINGIYFQQFNGAITNISGKNIDFGSYNLVFRTESGSLVERKMYTIAGLKNNISQLVFSSFTSTKLCGKITLDLVNTEFE